MSLVGPRPEIRKYVDFYTDDQLKLLQVRPGITDPASIYYSRENEILVNSNDPEKTYINKILPHKLDLSGTYAHNPNLIDYFKYIFLTIKKIFFGYA